ncbi:MAG: hypothetical protein ACXIVQ_09595 [Acidimicrobiales bacterium]
MHRLVTVVQLVLVVLVGGALIAAGLPPAGMIPLTSAAGVALFLHRRDLHRTLAARRSPHAHLLEGAIVSFPVERVAIGRGSQTRILRDTRPLWSPGVLAFHGDGRAAFVPSSRRRDDRCWQGQVHRVELEPAKGRSTAARLLGDAPAQFIAHYPVPKIRGPLHEWIPVEVVDGFAERPDAANGGHMDDDVGGDPELTTRVRAAFGADAERAQEVILSYGTDPDHREVGRVRRALIVVSGGDLGHLEHYRQVAEVDYRDVLAWSEDAPPTP